jgi:glycosyltransferase involved in cell wall biosynthesis
MTPRNGKSENLRLGYIGTLVEHKGVHLLIKAVRSLDSKEKVDLKIYGDPTHFPEYYQYLHKLVSGDKRIKFCGTFPNDRIGNIFSELDVLVVPSVWYENTPLVIYNAQAAGCPVIATDLEGMSEVIDNEVNGLLFEKDDIRGLSEAIFRLANDRSLLLKLSQNARRPKSISEYVAETEKFYLKIINKKESRK